MPAPFDIRENRRRSKKTVIELEEMTEADIEKARLAHEKEAYNPYAKEKMKEYLESVMGKNAAISSEDLPMQSKRDLLCALSAVAYSDENGYSVEVLDGYLEVNQMLLRRFDITKEKKE